MKGFGLFGFGGAEKKTEQDIIDLSGKAIDEAKAADAVLISCGGLLTLGCAVPIEQRHGIPVVTSTQSAFWKALRLAGDSGHVAGRGRMLAQSAAGARLINAGGPRAPGGCGAAESSISQPEMKARVTVTLKSGILDPQGKAIEGALKSLGVAGVASVRQGKVFDIEVEGADQAQAEAALKDAAEKLLANTVIENYRIEVRGVAMKSAVVVFPGINRERDMARTLRLVSGREPAMVWHADTALPAGTDLVVIPGGFSYGDYLRCGAIAARAPIMDAVRAHAARGGLVLGGLQRLPDRSARPGCCPAC